MGTDVESKNSSFNSNYGIIALIFLAASGYAFFYGISFTANTISCMFSSPSAGKTVGEDMTVGQLIMAGGVLGIIMALAFAGAGLATGRGNVSALLTILLVMLPVIYYAVLLVFGPTAGGMNPDIDINAPSGLAYANVCSKN